MTKVEFIISLRERLKKLPDFERSRTISFYAEMIDDRMEEGMPEEDAVASLGSLDHIVSETLVDTPWSTLIQTKLKKSKQKSDNPWVWKALAICGLPIWLPLVIAFAAVIASLYIAVGAVVFSLFAVELSLLLAGISGLIGTVVLTAQLHFATAGATFGMSLVCFGLFLMSILPLKWLARQFFALAGLWIRKLKSLFINKQEV